MPWSIPAVKFSSFTSCTFLYHEVHSSKAIATHLWRRNAKERLPKKDKEEKPLEKLNSFVDGRCWQTDSSSAPGAGDFDLISKTPLRSAGYGFHSNSHRCSFGPRAGGSECHRWKCHLDRTAILSNTPRSNAEWVTKRGTDGCLLKSLSDLNLGFSKCADLSRSNCLLCDSFK